MNAKQIEDRLLANFPDAKLKITDYTGGGDHWQVNIQSNAFQNKTLIEQHQLVYAALGEWMKHEIHALALTTEVLT
jgi:stress-induced morphogen